MFGLAARIVSTVVALVCQPIPPHAKTARPTTLVGEAPSGTAETGEDGGRPTSTPDGAPSPVIPDVEQVPGWAPDPSVLAGHPMPYPAACEYARRDRRDHTAS